MKHSPNQLLHTAAIIAVAPELQLQLIHGTEPVTWGRLVELNFSDKNRLENVGLYHAITLQRWDV